MLKIKNIASRSVNYWLVALLAIGLGTFKPTLAKVSTNEEATYIKVVEDAQQLMLEHHYNHKELQTSAYLNTIQELKALAKSADSKESFISGFNQIWQQGPFSHVMLTPARGTAEQMAQHLDNMKVGDGAVQLSIEGNIATLVINTMMGIDTIEAIRKAYQQIANSDANALIIDLRFNEGGAFAIRPLIAHLIDKPLDVGFFISQNWTKNNSQLPGESELNKAKSWDGWSITAFWQDALTQPFLKITMQPEQPHIAIPVYILTSSKTSSASELAIDALKSSGRATVTGEATAGKMLSQKPFDLPGGYHLFIPIADYFSFQTGRIEGNPIEPNIKSAAADAMKVVLAQIGKD